MKGICELAKGIGQNAQLKVLNLNDNTFTAQGAVAMSRAIRNIQHCLRSVDFGDCLCREGALEIIEAISDNHYDTIHVCATFDRFFHVLRSKFFISVHRLVWK